MAANDVQHGGDHYRKLGIQHWDYITANGIPYLEACAIKYLTRWRDKGGIEDLHKAKHYVEKLIEGASIEEQDLKTVGCCYSQMPTYITVTTTKVDNCEHSYDLFEGRATGPNADKPSFQACVKCFCKKPTGFDNDRR